MTGPRPPRQARRDRAISPLIGVVLMVAMTVLLAAAIGNFVLAIGDDAGNRAPTVRFAVDSDSATGDITLAHQGGEDVVDTETAILVTNGSSGVTLRFAPTSEAVLSTGGDVVLDLDASPNAQIRSSSDVWGGTAASGSFPGVRPDASYTVEVIDLGSERVFFDVTLGG